MSIEVLAKTSTDIGLNLSVNLTNLMSNYYFDYAQEVILDRALPDYRDGLKPIHRKILVTASDLDMVPGKKLKKSIKLVGDVLGRK
jgi:DNA gyrase subunit A